MDALSAACIAVLGAPPATRQKLHGGDLSDVVRLCLDDGREVVAKSGPMVAREARMLAAITEAGAPAPRVLGVAGDVLLMEALDEIAPRDDAWARFGRDLAMLHARTGAGYGWPEDYAFGPVAIANTPAPDWPRFWAARRLRPFLPHLPPALAIRVERLAERLSDLLPEAPPPALLHGDLWSGNLLAGPGGRFFLIDPACYHGDGEVDLAMLHLFGGPGPGFAEAYGPLAPGWRERRAVYSLFPALVHVRLFGAGYHAIAERFLAALRM
jgi:fructosamine-3-kinase